MVSDITGRFLPEIEDWQQRPLSQVYQVVYIDAVHFFVRDNHFIKKLATYIILGINEEGRKEVLSIQVGQNESAKYWLSILNEFKNRGVKDIIYHVHSEEQGHARMFEVTEKWQEHYSNAMKI